MPKVRTWTTEEEKIIIDNWNRMTKLKLAKKLCCPVTTLNNKGHKLGLSFKPTNIRLPKENHRRGELLQALGYSFNPWECKGR